MSAGYTDADVQLVATGVRLRIGWAISAGEAATIAQAALMTLAEAGRLTPDGATREVEYALRYDREDGTAWYSEPYYRRDLAETHRDGPETVVQRTILAGPWVEADEDGTG